ncbi:MAG: MBL fold metallo-hydrolase [Nitrososphaerota archaeon]
MRLKILGAGCIIPTPRRFASGLYLQVAGVRVLIDPGPGAMEKLRRTGVTPQRLDYILVTHFHLDHFADFLPIVMARAFGEDGLPAVDAKPLNAVGPRGFERLYRRLVVDVDEFSYLSKMMKCLDYVRVTEMSCGDTLQMGRATVKAAEVEHFNGVAYRIECEDVSIVFSGDTIPDERLVNLAIGCDILVHECSFPHGELVGKHTSEIQLAEITSKVRPRMVVATHLYPAWEGREDSIVQVLASTGVKALVAQDMMDVI